MFVRRAVPIKGEHAISELIEVMIGDVKQWIYIRGQNRYHPVLLMIHGGPGTAQIGFIRKFQSELEQHFVVVQWDQRGAGLSYSRDILSKSMNIDQLVDDTIDVTTYVLNHLNQQQLYLVGHSWGTILSMLALTRAPELYTRYFGISQVTHAGESDRLSYTKLLERAQADKNEKAYNTLLQIGPPPWDSLKHGRIHQKYVELLGGGITRDGKMVRKILLNILTSKEYTWLDSLRFFKGQFFSMENLQAEMENTNLLNNIKEINIPIYFLMGKYDLITPYELTEQLFNQIKAPEKQLIVFENSAHTPTLEEPERYMQILLAETRKDKIY